MSLVVSGGIIRGSGPGLYAPRKTRYGGGMSIHMNFSASAATTTNNHLCRIITQADWGMTTMLVHVRKRAYSLETHMDSLYRVEAYYDNFNIDYVSGDQRPQLSFQTFGPGGSGQIHDDANGGYYRDAWGRDLVASVPYYQNIDFELNVMSTSGFLRDQSTSLTTVYPANFNSTASQGGADSWGFGRGVWFNSAPGTVQDT
jgi:hypothetical protein